MPTRIQLSRKKGWKMPAGTVSVARPGKYGNPFRIGHLSEYGDVPDAETALMFYRAWIDKGLQIINIRRDLAGVNLACWCKIGSPCHADFLLKLANKNHPA